MYIDGVIIFSLVMIALILVMMAFIGVYFFKHIKLDTQQAQRTLDTEMSRDKSYSV